MFVCCKVRDETGKIQLNEPARARTLTGVGQVITVIATPFSLHRPVEKNTAESKSVRRGTALAGSSKEMRFVLPRMATQAATAAGWRRNNSGFYSWQALVCRKHFAGFAPQINAKTNIVLNGILGYCFHVG